MRGQKRNQGRIRNNPVSGWTVAEWQNTTLARSPQQPEKQTNAIQGGARFGFCFRHGRGGWMLNLRSLLDTQVEVVPLAIKARMQTELGAISITTTANQGTERY